jgi:hypothetical protein
LEKLMLVALQKALRLRLVASTAVVSLVPAQNIVDRNSRPAPNPSIVLGEDHAVDDDDIARSKQRIFSTIHVWKEETSLEGVKAIAWAIRKAINAGRLDMDPGFHCADCSVIDMRFVRDPDGETSHGVVTVESLVSEI